ncbi:MULTISPECIES: oleate hydratase [unclassified Thiocapsa]|uniref:oleate hydratase n=1 Tax=unclassified Thiocapsa TaxID=2641286 RepID=UPI0035B390E8
MYYSNGNDEAFARPRKPKGTENRTAWLVGSGLAALAGAAFLIRDGQMPGNRITILEQHQLPGCALDGIKEPNKGFVIRGGREMEEHFECLWDLYRSIPSLEIEGASVLDEFYWLDKDDPNSSLQRATVNRGEDAHTDGLFTLSEQAQKEIVKLFLATGWDGVEGGVDLGPDDLVFMTIGSLTENSDNGDHHTPANLNVGPAPAWDLWRRIAAKDPAFGHPDVFGSHIPETKWESATVTTLDERIPKYIQKIAKRDPFSGKVVTGGIVTAKDSSWLLSWTVNRQPHFKQQPKGQIVVWVYALFVEQPGDYVKKPMQDCSGEEITREWLYHLGVPVEDIPELAATGAITVPVMMPYVTAFFMPRQAGDRPDVVPEGAVNFAFIGQFAESKERDCIFTTEYSVRAPMEAV